jgi:hypothetical protein
MSSQGRNLCPCICTGGTSRRLRAPCLRREASSEANRRTAASTIGDRRRDHQRCFVGPHVERPTARIRSPTGGVGGGSIDYRIRPPARARLASALATKRNFGTARCLPPTSKQNLAGAAPTRSCLHHRAGVGRCRDDVIARGRPAVAPVGRATGGCPTTAPGALDRRSHARTCGWLLDLHFRSANPNAASDVVVGLALAGRPERQP